VPNDEPTVATRSASAPYPVSLALKVFAVGNLIGAVFFLTGAVEPSTLLAAGELGPSRDLVVQDFPDVELQDDVGYDGQQFYAIAAELPDLHDAAEHLDDPRYRLLRIFAPLVASVMPRGDATVLALLEINIVGLALAVGGLSSLCQQSGRRPALGLFALVPIFQPTFLTVIDPIATGLTFAALALLVRNQLWAASGVFALACLTREGVAAIVAAAALALLVQRRRLWPPVILSLSVLPLAAWYLYLVDEIGGDLPDRWGMLAFLDVPGSYTLIAAICLGLGVLATIGWRAQPVVAAAAAVTTVQMPFFFEDIYIPSGITRVTAVALSLGMVVVAEWWLDRRSPS